MGIQRRLSRPESVARSTGRTRPTERCGSFHLRCEQDRRKGSRERHRILQASLVIKFVLAGSWPSLRQLRHLAGLNVRALQPRYLYGFFVCSSFLKYNVIRFWFGETGKSRSSHLLDFAHTWLAAEAEARAPSTRCRRAGVTSRGARVTRRSP